MRPSLVRCRPRAALGAAALVGTALAVTSTAARAQDPRLCGAGGDGCRAKGEVIWQQSTSPHAAVELAVRDKAGTLGGYVVRFVVIAPDGAQYAVRRRTGAADEFVTVRFPDDFRRPDDPQAAPDPVAGDYRWVALVNRTAVVEDHFRGVKKGYEVRLEP